MVELVEKRLSRPIKLIVRDWCNEPWFRIIDVLLVLSLVTD
jgi:hypothetical protein